ncbi:MAG: hypothetical protein HRT38_02725 [Alteromonadaceae bacterium]|nr:hypothetical protein [Alteromonadaceae bacterium]
MENLLIGSENHIDVKCKALMESNGKKVEVSFIAVFTRLKRSESHALGQRINDAQRNIRLIGREILLLEHDNVACIAVEEGEEKGKDKLVLITGNNDTADQVPLTDAEKTTHRIRLDNEIDEINRELDEEITKNLHNIKNLMNVNRKNVEYSKELVVEMLDIEPYFNALCDGLSRSNGVYLDKRAKNS